MEGGQPLLSIFCITYNHAAYIDDAIKGFLQQQTNFPIEIVIHDDASTDGTDEIIREYERQYPDLFFPIYEKENQYSKGVRFDRDIIMPKIRGKYVAFCEGDDYWTNPHKLQKQVDYLEKHPECSASVHTANVIYEDRLLYTNMRAEAECDFSAKDVILGRGMLAATASIVCRTRYAREFPSYRLLTTTGDFSLMLLLGDRGLIHYFPEVMSVYRWQNPGSWSARHQQDKGKMMAHFKDMLEWCIAANIDTDGKYKHLFWVMFENILSELCRAGYFTLEAAIAYKNKF